MHPTQFLNQVPHILHAGSEIFAELSLRCLVQVKKPLHHFAVHKPERAIRFSSLVAKGSPSVEVDASRRFDVLLYICLERNE